MRVKTRIEFEYDTEYDIEREHKEATYMANEVLKEFFADVDSKVVAVAVSPV